MEIKDLYDIYLKYPVVCTDTRRITPDCLFFALTGSKFNGNVFAQDALDKGAAYAVVSDVTLKGKSFIVVDNTLMALQQLANYHRRHFDKPFIAITGSNGKTTTKELITTVLSGGYKVHSTSGNFNNHIGVPLTLLSIPSNMEIAVIEMGANHIGEIDALCQIAMPTHGLITNIGKAHLEGFGSVEGVRQAKGELFEYLKATNGYAFVNTDDPGTKELGASLIEKTTYGLLKEENPNVLFEYSNGISGKGFSIRDDKGHVEIHSEMFGHYNAINMVAAFCVGQHFDIPDETIIKLLSSFIPGANRSETIFINGCTVIKDAYNANPSSMELALQSFWERFQGGTVILGSMKELGNDSSNLHKSIILSTQNKGFDNIYLIGPEFRMAYDEIKIDKSNIILVDSVDELKKSWDWAQMNGKSILLKGSRSMQLEKLLED